MACRLIQNNKVLSQMVQNGPMCNNDMPIHLLVMHTSIVHILVSILMFLMFYEQLGNVW